MPRQTTIVSLILAALVAGGCQSSRSGRVYSRDEARAGIRVEQGVVEHVNTDVSIEGTKTPIGAAAGAVMGGVLGHAVGGGAGKDIATVAGALGGAAAGAASEEAITRRKAIEITVRLDSGSTIAIVQEADEAFAVGDRVRVLTAPDGSKRVRH